MNALQGQFCLVGGVFDSWKQHFTSTKHNKTNTEGQLKSLPCKCVLVEPIIIKFQIKSERKHKQKLNSNIKAGANLKSIDLNGPIILVVRNPFK